MDQTTAQAQGSIAVELANLRRRLAEAEATIAELRQRDAHVRMAMEASRVVAYQWDILEDRVTRLRSSTELGGFEDAGNFESVVAKVVPEDQAAFRAHIRSALASPEGLYRTEVRYRDRDGSIRWVSESGRVVRDARGQPLRIVGVTFDITERKEAEEALRGAEGLLREQDRRKNEFLATLAHELRNPLAPIRNATQILRMHETRAEMRNLHAIIERQMQHMVRLVDDLLDVSRISRGHVELRRERVSLDSIIAQAVEAARPGIDRAGHRLEILAPDDRVWLVADAVRLVQAVLNLLTNATKYTPPGGRITLRAAADHAHAEIRVADSGIGMSESQLARVFEMFWQARAAPSQGPEGLGIGLSLAKSVVEMHAGKIEARSAGPGHGSEFTIRLPIAA